ncbi:GntR family phosphonate transport system transcriptional regulator [Pseudaminobacter salicylatoxidans]|uniref:GntR family phosphonate transport system transcriptional regulator n=1 Tax=Pseudaminobacter salicylatoxidans TaxID=93369 RepID=A0A316C3B7_PSESE|nr:phosphonate metabolism transcriptional regulator PhnF [Pseudaminobacter salicylatoxidans]PWJ84161.1 GntR family phosphonate transport system transcriptional regulator [Pseudaminobacter salicylatoxidans]
MEQAGEELMERRSGVALWRQVADRIRLGISNGTLGDGSKLPPEITLSQQFGVNRHTVRAAISALVQEGVLRAEQGRGTFIESRKRLSYPITTRTRFSTGLKDQTRARRVALLRHTIEPASGRVAEALRLEPGAPVLRLETVSEADGRCVSCGTSWFDATRFPAFADVFAETESVTASFARFGVDDYVRRSTLVSARHADADDLDHLKLSPGAIVLVTIAINDDLEGRPIQFSQTHFSADLVELAIET